MAEQDPAPTALLFGRDEVDEVDDWIGRIGRLGRNSILWIDLPRPDDEQARDLANALELAPASAERLADHKGMPFFGDFGTYIHVTAYAPAANGARSELERVVCLVSKQWVVTVHDGDVPVLEAFRERAEGGSGESTADASPTPLPMTTTPISPANITPAKIRITSSIRLPYAAAASSRWAASPFTVQTPGRTHLPPWPSAPAEGTRLTRGIPRARHDRRDSV